MMTTACALLGGMPLALGSGVGSELRRPLGIAIVGGLLVSQMLTLFTTPVIYLSLDRLRKRFSRAHHASTGPDCSFPVAPRSGGLMITYWKIARFVLFARLRGLLDRPEIPAARRRPDAGGFQGTERVTTNGRWLLPAISCSKANGGRCSTIRN